jgi:hypothetical protein
LIMSDFCTDRKTVRAAKSHRCDVCNRVINQGDQHDTWSGRYDGGFYRARVHGPCLDAAREADSCDGEIPPLYDYSQEEQAQIFHQAGKLREAWIYLALDLADTPMDGMDLEAVIAYLDQQASEQRARDVERLRRWLATGGWKEWQLSRDDRRIAREEGLIGVAS